MTTRRIALAIFAVALSVLAFHGAAHAAEQKPEAKPVIAVTNNYQAYAAAVESANAAKVGACEAKATSIKAMADKCKDDMCRMAFGILLDKQCQETGGSQQVAQIAPPPVEKSVWTEIKETLFDTARMALPVFDRIMTSRERRDATASAERQQGAMLNMFTTVNGQTANLGAAGIAGMRDLGTAGINGVRDTALGLTDSYSRAFTAALTRDTYQINVINSSDTTLFGSLNYRQYSNQCQGGTGSATTGNPAGGQAPCTIGK